MKIVYCKEILNIISAYTPQVGIEESIKKKFWGDLGDQYGAKHNNE